MTNWTKWLVAIPFTFIVAVLVPAFVAGDADWFLDRWTDTLFQLLAIAMWLLATAFVDLNRPRGVPDRANRLIPLGLILAAPVAVWDRTYGLAAGMPDLVLLGGVLISFSAALVGLSARIALGRSYVPRGNHLGGAGLVRAGVYRRIRHPLYLAALLWVVGWPLTIGSVFGPLAALGFVLPAVLRRMDREEAELRRIYGGTYVEYLRSSWRLIPFVY